MSCCPWFRNLCKKSSANKPQRLLEESVEEDTEQESIYIKSISDNTLTRATEFKLTCRRRSSAAPVTVKLLQDFDKEIETARSTVWATDLTKADSRVLETIEKIIQKERQSMGDTLEAIFNSDVGKPAVYDGVPLLKRSVKSTKEQVEEELEEMRKRLWNLGNWLNLARSVSPKQAEEHQVEEASENDEVQREVSSMDSDDLSRSDYWALESISSNPAGGGELENKVDAKKLSNSFISDDEDCHDYWALASTETINKSK